MGDDLGMIRAATPQDVDSIAGTLAASFRDDPLCAWEFPDEDSRLRILPALFGFVARHLYVPSGWSAVAPGGAALWQDPGDAHSERLTPEQEREFVAVVEGQVGRLVALAGLLANVRPREPHWYLASIGVEPDAQGSGVGAGLLAFTLEQIDARGEASYLEASTPRSAALYERHGFETIGEYSVDGSPPLWPMWRPARPS